MNRNPELETRLLEQPDDLEIWREYAQWWKDIDEPELGRRVELHALLHEIELDAPPPTDQGDAVEGWFPGADPKHVAKLEAAGIKSIATLAKWRPKQLIALPAISRPVVKKFSALLAERQLELPLDSGPIKKLLKPLGPLVPGVPDVRLSPRFGFPGELDIPSYDKNAKFLPDILAHDASAFVRCLRYQPAPGDLDALAQRGAFLLTELALNVDDEIHFAGGHFPALRRLEITRLCRTIEDPTPYLQAAPALEQLVLDGWGPAITEPLHHGTLEELVIANSASPECFQLLLDSRFPKLRTLRVVDCSDVCVRLLCDWTPPEGVKLLVEGDLELDTMQRLDERGILAAENRLQGTWKLEWSSFARADGPEVEGWSLDRNPWGYLLYDMRDGNEQDFLGEMPESSLELREDLGFSSTDAPTEGCDRPVWYDAEGVETALGSGRAVLEGRYRLLDSNSALLGAVEGDCRYDDGDTMVRDSIRLTDGKLSRRIRVITDGRYLSLVRAVYQRDA